MSRGLPAAANRGAADWPLLAVIAVVAAGLVLVGIGHWRIGTIAFGAAMLLGALERALLPTSAAGLLRVRSRWFDVTLMGLLGAAIGAVALSVPSWE